MTDNNYEILRTICKSRKSTRCFSNKDVSEEIIQKIIDIAKTSPYASGQKNWDIQAITSNELIESIVDCINMKSVELTDLMKEDLKEHFMAYSKSFTFFRNAPVLLILTFRISPVMTAMMGEKVSPEILQWERDNFTKSISCVAMLILLAAESLGLGACYMTGPVIAQQSIMKIAGSKPGREIGAVIPIGFKE